MESGKEGIGAGTSHDQEIWARISKLVKDYNVSSQDLLANFPAYARRIHLSRFLAHYEIFKKVIELPGCIAELGVFRGSSMLTFAKLLEIFNPGDRARKVIGFDHFQGLQGFNPLDGENVYSARKANRDGKRRYQEVSS